MGERDHRKQGRQPDLILLDLSLPTLSGMEVLRQINGDALLCKTPVIVLTGSDREADQVRSQLLGATAFLMKPVDYRRFTEALAALGERWPLVGKLPDAA